MNQRARIHGPICLHYIYRPICPFPKHFSTSRCHSTMYSGTTKICNLLNFEKKKKKTESDPDRDLWEDCHYWCHCIMTGSSIECHIRHLGCQVAFPQDPSISICMHGRLFVSTPLVILCEPFDVTAVSQQWRQEVTNRANYSGCYADKIRFNADGASITFFFLPNLVSFSPLIFGLSLRPSCGIMHIMFSLASTLVSRLSMDGSTRTYSTDVTNTQNVQGFYLSIFAGAETGANPNIIQVAYFPLNVQMRTKMIPRSGVIHLTRLCSNQLLHPTNPVPPPGLVPGGGGWPFAYIMFSCKLNEPEPTTRVCQIGW